MDRYEISKKPDREPVLNPVDPDPYHQEELRRILSTKEGRQKLSESFMVPPRCGGLDYVDGEPVYPAGRRFLHDRSTLCSAEDHTRNGRTRPFIVKNAGGYFVMETKKQVIHKIKDDPARFIFFCPGCGCGHQFWTEGATKWNFNGDLEKPTITPSILILYGNHGDKGRCHSFVTEGKIKFLDDSTHELKGKEIELDDLNNDKFYESPIFHRDTTGL